MSDVGKPKAVVAAERINARVSGANVKAHFGRIEDMPLEFYQEFTVIILGLDSLEARRYMNSVACSLLGGESASRPSQLYQICLAHQATFALWVTKASYKAA
jgi:ubiquitin-activating enzyme E1 C